MLRVKIEMCPRGNESSDRVREIGRMYIANDGGTIERGDYKVAVCRRGSTAVPREVFGHTDRLLLESWSDDALKRYPKATRSGEVKDYPRLAYNVWRLIARAVLEAFPEERKTRPHETVVDEQVMRGLQLIRRQAVGAIGKPSGSLLDDERVDVAAALEWLDAGKQDDDL